MKSLVSSCLCMFVLFGISGCTTKEEENSVLEYLASPECTPTITFEVHKAEQQPGNNLEEASIKRPPQTIYVHPEILLANADIRATSVEMLQITEDEIRFQINVVLTSEGSEKLARIAETHMNKEIAILLDGKIVSSPWIKGQTVGRLTIASFNTRGKAESVAKGLVGQ
jgi:preprotein translocase subunit SecD